MSTIKQTDFFDKVDVSVSVAKIIFSFLEHKYPCKTIGEIATTTSGGTPLRGHSDYYGGETPWIKSGELNDGIIKNFEETITEEGLKNSSAKVYPKGTLVLALYGATAGKTGIVDFNTASNQAVAAIYPNDKIERDYLFWFFRQKRFDYIQMSFGAAQPNISQTVVKATRIAVPEKNIQKEVVDFLNAIENDRELTWKNSLEPIWNKLKSFYNLYQTRQTLLKELDQQQTYLELLRQTILQEAVQGKLTNQDPTDEPASSLLKHIKAEKEKLVKAGKLRKEKELPPITEDEIPFELPEGWVWSRLADVALKVTDGTHHSPPNIASGDYMYVTAKNIKDEGVLLDNISYVTKKVHDEIYSRCNPEYGDILYIKDGATTGVVTINNLEVPFSMLSSVALIKVPKDISNTYLLYVLRSPYYYKAVRNDMAGIAITRVTLTKMVSTFIPLPPLAEQQRIVAKVQCLQQQLSQLEVQVQQSRQYAQQLLQSVLREAFEQKGKVYEMNEEVSMVAES